MMQIWIVITISSFEQTTRIFDIADVPFTQVSDLEKQKYAGKMLETGSYTGYKLRRYWVRYPVLIAHLPL